MSNSKEEEAEAFKKWFVGQRAYGSLSAMERALGITRDYLHLIRDGTRRAVDPELRGKLREATGLTIFEPIQAASVTSAKLMTNVKRTRRAARTSSIPGVVSSKQNLSTDVKVRELPADTGILVRELKELREKVEQMDAKMTAARMYQETGKKSVSTNANEKARTVMRLLSSLSSELEFFKNCTEDERATFRKTIPGEDIGYITTLLRALYDEDKFQRWLFFSKYTMKGNDDGE